MAPTTDNGLVSLVAGQATAEPAEAVHAIIIRLLAQGVERVSLYRGMSLCAAGLIPEDPRVRVRSTGLLGSNKDIWQRGQLDVVPEPVSKIPRLLRTGALPNDILVLRATPVPGGFSTGTVSDYVPAALDSATEIVLQVTDGLPTLPGAPVIPRERVSEVLTFGAQDTIPVFASSDPTPVDAALAAHVAGLVRNGDTIQVGLGGLGAAIAKALATSRRQLGIHTGLIDDNILDLIDSGAVSNARKPLDRGYSVTPIVMGSTRLYQRVSGRKDILLQPVDQTNDPAVIGRLNGFVAINSAVEVDLLGQVNAEMVRGRRLSTVGGQSDYLTGANLAAEGRSVAVVRATAGGGAVSRIVPVLNDSVVTVPAGHVDVVVTEFGVAELRGASLEERAHRLIAVADPRFRKFLRDALEHDERIHPGPSIRTSNTVEASA